MLWMETFCFHCSVRLGVIVSATVSLFQDLITIILFSLYATTIVRTAKHYFERDELQNQDVILRRVFDGLSERHRFHMIWSNILLAFHILACLSAIYGAFKLQKSYLRPYIVSQFLIFITMLTQHILAMIFLKKIVNLGILIGMTLAGGFYILFMGYSWAAAVALFQIIVLVNSEKYKNLYGEDIMAPMKRRDVLLGQGAIENIKIFTTPNHAEISALKRKRLIEEQLNQRYERNIVSVVAMDKLSSKDDVDLISFNNWHWNELVGVRKGFK